MGRIFRYISVFILLFISLVSVKANSNSIYVNLNDMTYSNEDNNYTNIVEYKTLDEFLKDYNNNSLPSIYITDFLFDGVSTVKSPDLDDFIDSGSNDTKIKTLSIKVININTYGDITFSGEATGYMIGVDTNNKVGNTNIILNGVKLDTDSKKAPAIYVYNKDKNYTDCIVTIKTVKGTSNYIEGGKLKKVSLLDKDELSKYSSYYSNDALTNYNKYSSYYGIYTSEQIKNILFATVTADSEDLADGDPYYFYKASGAISSDIDLYFEGVGYLEVTSKNKEGIETKGNLTFSGGTGDYAIYAQDDCLNTTTASSNGTVRNDLVIDVNSLLAVVDPDGDEGDAIDSNGKLIINGGTIYAFAHPTSADAGLDSNNGIYINGGTVIATGNMADQVSNDSKQKYIYATFNEKIDSDTLLVIKDNSGNVITAFKTNRSISNLLYSSSNIKDSNYKIYKGGTISGEEVNGLYTVINSYTGGEEISYSSNSNYTNKENNNILLIALLIEVFTLIIFVIINRKTISQL